MKRRNFSLTTGVAALAALAARGTAQAQSRGPHALEGAWRVTITTGPGAPPNQPAQWETFITFAAGGTVLDHNGAPGGTPAHGVWEFTGNNVFDATWQRFLYDNQGQIMFLNKVRSRIQVISDDEYTNDVKVEIWNPAGQLLTSWMNTSRGRRVAVEPIG